MAINIRQKGAGGEQEIATELNLIINMVRMQLGIPVPGTPTVQRNQNQSAVGGKDLIGTYGLAIEVKRQEALSIGSWWAQCVKSAEDLNEIPVLLFRQNKQKWRCVIFVDVPLPAPQGTVYKSARMRAEISYDDFKTWFRMRAEHHLSQRVIKENPEFSHPGLF